MSLAGLEDFAPLRPYPRANRILDGHRGYAPLPTPIGPVPFWRKWWSWFHRIATAPTESRGAR